MASSNIKPVQKSDQQMRVGHKKREKLELWKYDSSRRMKYVRMKYKIFTESNLDSRHTGSWSDLVEKFRTTIIFKKLKVPTCELKKTDLFLITVEDWIHFSDQSYIDSVCTEARFVSASIKFFNEYFFNLQNYANKEKKWVILDCIMVVFFGDGRMSGNMRGTVSVRSVSLQCNKD